MPGRRTCGGAGLCLAVISALAATMAAPAAEQARQATTPRDAGDGWFDASDFLDHAHGFLPLVTPITEPAVGYGALGALVFIDRNAPGEATGYARPDITAVGGLATENGTGGVFALHLGSWLDDRLHTIAGMASTHVDLEFFGLGGDHVSADNPLDYTVEARGGLAGGSYRWGTLPLWVGLRYALVNTTVSPGEPPAGFPGFTPEDRDLRLGMLTPTITLDTRDNFFTPTRGWYLDLSPQVFRDWLGGDRDFEKWTLTGLYYRPLGANLFLAARATGKTSSSGTPFFLRPYVALRGVQALAYQGEKAAEVEGELRWQFHPRFSLAGFAGGGIARGGDATPDRDSEVIAGGAGLRYLVASRYGLHMGLDLALGPDDPVIYVVLGSAWLRP
ncbi:MAG: BamA/TamA family outer membrane protein [Gammaproteobacteria bacterium]|nr:BamA/TamA family outer membrane protein [Gammaproteobacteria bacterium]